MKDIVQIDGGYYTKVRKRLYSLDGIRGLFILFVVIHHYYLSLANGELSGVPFANALGFLYENGWMGVEFFFALSGFCISYAYCDRIASDASFTMGKFIVGRLKKIWPLAVITTVANMLLEIKQINLLRALLSIMLMQYGWIWLDEPPYNGVEWFLNVLLLCYILFFFIARFKQKSKDVYFLLLGIMVILGAICMAYNLEIPFLYGRTGRGYMAFFSGGILYEIQECLSSNKKKVVSVVYGGGVFILMLTTLIFGVKVVFGGTTIFRFFLNLVITPGIIMCILNIKWLSNLFSKKVFVTFGKWSMSTFLWHPFVFSLIEYIDNKLKLNLSYEMPIIFGLIIIVVYLTSIASYYLLERKFLPYVLEKWDNL